MEADYLNESNQQILHKPDHGAPPKQLTGSYSNAYLDTNDTDKDGLFDFVEWQIKTDSTDVDTDGDGVPDGQEFLDDNTLPNDASDYLPSKPLTDVTAYDGSKDVTVTGTVSKPLIADPSDTSKLLQITDAAAGNVTVKLQAYDEASNSYTDTTYGTATIPFADLVTGNFSINVGANTIPDGTKVVLVSYSPNGKHAVMGDPLSFSVPDKDKYNANGGTVNQDYGTKAKEQDILDAVTVTETKGGQEVPVSADKIQQKAIKGTIPEPSADGSDQTVTVEVTYADGSKEEGDACIIATGGVSYQTTGSTGDGYRFAEAMGHKITEPAPSLVPMNVREEYIPALMGLSLRNVQATVYDGKKELYSDFGEMLFTHFGVSGPLIISASAYVGKILQKKHELKLVIDLKPALSEEQLDARVLREFDANHNKQFKNAVTGLFPAKLLPVMIHLSGIDPEKKVNVITKEERMNFVHLIKHFTVTLTGLRDFKEAIITRGGVKVKEVNPSTMESKLVQGLYFAGEVLDLDALTGGFNLQIAWSTAYAAGSNIW